MDLWSLDKERINSLYESEKQILKGRLLEGTAWESTKEQRLKLAELSYILYRKLNPTGPSHPAEGQNRP